MKQFIKKKIGKTIHTFEVEGENLHELTMEAQKLSFGDVNFCGWCDSQNLILNARRAEGFAYTEVKCLDCKATLTFGQKKADKDTFYLRKNDDKRYDWKQYNPEKNLQTNKFTKSVAPVEYSH